MPNIETSRRPERVSATCSPGHHGQAPRARQEEAEISALGLRPEATDQPLPPRDRYENLIAQAYADQGHVKFAEFVEAGHVCAACHLTRPLNRIPKDGELDLERYSTVASLARVARVTTEIVTSGYVSAVSAMEVRVASQSFRITARALTEPLDQITLRKVGEELASNPIARRAYQQLQRQGTNVVFDFGPPPLDADMAIAMPRANLVVIYVRRHESVKDVVASLVHESSHIHRGFRGNVITRLDEVRAFSRQFLYENGHRPRLADRAEIWKHVRAHYGHLEQ